MSILKMPNIEKLKNKIMISPSLRATHHAELHFEMCVLTLFIYVFVNTHTHTHGFFLTYSFVILLLQHYFKNNFLFNLDF